MRSASDPRLYLGALIHFCKRKIKLITFKDPVTYRAVNTLRLGYTNQSVNAV